MRRFFGKRMVSAIVVAGCLAGGCQQPAVMLSDGRQVTLADIEREVTVARQRLASISARIVSQRWEYIDLVLLTGGGVVFEGMDPIDAAHTRNLNLYRRIEQCYRFDAAKKRQVVFEKDLQDLQTLARLFGIPDKGCSDCPFEPLESVELVQWKANGEELAVMLTKGAPPDVTLERREAGDMPSPPREPMSHGLYDLSLLIQAERGEARMEVVREDGLELVKVMVGTPASRTAWFRPDMGYRVHRIEQREPCDGRKLISTTKASDYRIVDGVPYPFKFEETRFGGPGHSQLMQQTRVEATSVEFGVPPRDAEFEVQLPQGSRLVLVTRPESLGWRRHPDGGFVTVGTADQRTTLAPIRESVRVDASRVFEIAAALPQVENERRCAPR